MSAGRKKTLPVQAIHYQVEIASLHAHLFRVTLTVPEPQAEQVLQLPVWIPGSYLIREFAKNLQKLQCSQSGRDVKATQRDKTSWSVPCKPGVALQVQYEVYAFDNSVRTAWLDASRGFFNGTSLFLKVAGAENLSHTVDILASDEAPDWKLATALSPVRVQKSGFGRYRADNYDTLVDCPVEMGTFWSGTFSAGGIPHRFVVAGVTDSFDGKQLLDDTQAICEEEIRFWHGEQQKTGAKGNKGFATPHANYLFMLNTAHDGYGGLEHRNSTALLCDRKDLPRLPRQTLAPAVHKQPEGYTTLLGLISHEYFIPGTSNDCGLPSWPVTTTCRKTTPNCYGSLRVSPAITTTCCYAERGELTMRPTSKDWQNHQPGAANTRTSGAKRGPSQLRRLDQVLPPRRKYGQRDRQLLHQRVTGRLVPGPNPACRRPHHTGCRNAGAVDAVRRRPHDGKRPAHGFTGTGRTAF